MASTRNFVFHLKRPRTLSKHFSNMRCSLSSLLNINYIQTCSYTNHSSLNTRATLLPCMHPPSIRDNNYSNTLLIGSSQISFPLPYGGLATSHGLHPIRHLSYHLQTDGCPAHRSLHTDGCPSHRRLHMDGCPSHRRLHTDGCPSHRRLHTDGCPSHRRLHTDGCPSHSLLATDGCPAHRRLHTGAGPAYRHVPPSTGFRPTSDHRGNITVGNRPESDFITEDDDDVNTLDDRDYSALLHNSVGFGIGVVGSAPLEGNMFIILPWIKWGANQKKATTDALLMDEAVALANSLQTVTVVDKAIVKIRYEAPDTVFGTGQLITLVERVKTITSLAVVFVSIDVLTLNQIRGLESAFNARVVDRYWLVLAIFHQHANTQEAKMQVALAELPYIRNRLKHDSERAVINERMKRIQAGLSKLRRHRQHIRDKRRTKQFPSVAVVGYTNTGKTSLISALSGDTSVRGRNQLFATLDVTAHSARLSCGLEVLLLDTIGFIQDLPTTLVASFTATLQDAAHADVILHVRDLSHPDRLMQHTTVMAALHSINLPTTTPIITVDNKADLQQQQEQQQDEDDKSSYQTVAAPTASCDSDKCVSYISHRDSTNAQRDSDPDALAPDVRDLDETPEQQMSRLAALKDHYYKTPSMIVSAKTKQGLAPVLTALEQLVLRVTNRRMYRMKLPTGGDQIRALRQLVGNVQETVLDENPGHTTVVCAMTEKQLVHFKKMCKLIANEAAHNQWGN